MKYGDGFVEWSVMEANRQRAGQVFPCPKCGVNALSYTNDINPEYRSQYNPGEVVISECHSCGFWDESPC